MSALSATRAAATTGWTPADEAQAMAVLHRIAAGKDGVVPQRDEIPGLFATQDPALERRFVTQLTAANTGYSAFRQAVAAWIAGATR